MEELAIRNKDSDRQLISFIIFLILFLLPVNPSFNARDGLLVVPRMSRGSKFQVFSRGKKRGHQASNLSSQQSIIN